MERTGGANVQLIYNSEVTKEELSPNKHDIDCIWREKGETDSGVEKGLLIRKHKNQYVWYPHHSVNKEATMKMLSLGRMIYGKSTVLGD